MHHRNRSMLVACALAGAALVAFAPTAGSATVLKPVIGKATTTPARAVAGSRFSLAVKVTRSDNGAPLTQGTASAAVTAAGKQVRPSTTFKGGVAHVSLLVPTAAKSLQVVLTVHAGAQSAAKTFRFAVAPVPKPSVTIEDAIVNEGNAGTSSLTFPVRLSSASKQAVSVGYATSDGTAKAPTDYGQATGTLTFAPGETSKSVSVSVVGDLAIEQDETLAVTLSAPVNATIARGSATGTIKNDDTQVPVTPGEYKGALPSGDYLYFEVTPARQFSYFRVNDMRENCDPGGYFEGSVAYPETTAWPISDDGSVLSDDNWSGSQQYGDLHYTHYEYKLTAKFDGSTNVTGTIQLVDEFDYQGYHFTCNTGVVNWTASRTG
jgi:hypothetical protein